MTKEELKQYLIDNLTLEYSSSEVQYGVSGNLKIILKLEDTIITELDIDGYDIKSTLNLNIS